jgi:hypothetical protein
MRKEGIKEGTQEAHSLKLPRLAWGKSTNGANKQAHRRKNKS